MLFGCRSSKIHSCGGAGKNRTFGRCQRARWLSAAALRIVDVGVSYGRIPQRALGLSDSRVDTPVVLLVGSGVLPLRRRHIRSFKYRRIAGLPGTMLCSIMAFFLLIPTGNTHVIVRYVSWYRHRLPACSSVHLFCRWCRRLGRPPCTPAVPPRRWRILHWKQ
jgi:hypothetical protein